MAYVFEEFETEIVEGVREALELAEETEIPLEIPDEKRGDYAVPCFAFSKILKKSPTEIAELLVNNISLELGEVEQSGPYANFKIDEGYLVRETLNDCLEKGALFGEHPSQEKKVIVEHTSANPNGPLHVGRARNPIIGDTVARIYQKMGYDVEKQYFVNDIGRQMAILTWGTMNLDEEELPKLERKKKDYEMVRYYQKASSILQEDESLEEEILEIIHSMEDYDEEIFEIFRNNADDVLEGITESLIRLGIYLDSYKNESDFIVDGSVYGVIDRMDKLEKCSREDGALYFEENGDRTFITRSDGTNLYPARDIAYHIWKAEKADELVNILGEDHKMHGKFLRDVLSEMDVNPVPEPIFYSFVTFEGEEMSTRKGTYVTLDDFMDTANEKAREEIVKRREDLEEEQIDKIAEKVGMGAVRFNIIKVQPEKPIDFRWEEALNFQGDSAPFVQYTYARSCGILDKFGEEINFENADLDKLSEEGEIKLIKTMAKYPIELRKALKNKAPHRIAKYALNLASEFNQFYRDYPVLKSEDKKIERLALVKAYKYAIKSVLDTLGLSAPEAM